jgi:murein L,D-transpeptidase YafK
MEHGMNVDAGCWSMFGASVLESLAFYILLMIEQG